MKKVLNLQEMISLQRTIETMIGDIQTKIIANNPILKKNRDKNNVNVPELYQKYDTLLEQLIIIKLAKDKANRKRTKLGGITNQHLILELSNLNRKRSLLETAFESKNHMRKGKEANAWEFQISKSEIDEKLVTISNRISEIKKSMTEFNNSTTVKVVIFEELNLL